MTLRAADDFDFIHERLKAIRSETASEQPDVVWYWDVSDAIWYFRPITEAARMSFVNRHYSVTRQPDWYGFSASNPSDLKNQMPSLTFREVAKPAGI